MIFLGNDQGEEEEMSKNWLSAKYGGTLTLDHPRIKAKEGKEF